MQIKTQKKKYIYIVIPVILILIGAGVALAFYLNNDKPVESTRSQSDVEQAEKLAENPNNKSTRPNSDQPNTPTPSGTSEKAQVQMIASANVSDGFVYIRGGLNFPESENGTCYANLVGPNGKTLRKDTEILPNPASADCKTIKVSVNELSPGNWKVKLQYTSASYEGVSNETEITID